MIKAWARFMSPESVSFPAHPKKETVSGVKNEKRRSLLGMTCAQS